MINTKFRIVTISLFFLLLTGVLKAQISINVNSEQDQNRKRKSGIITINAQDGQSEYSYYLLTDYPWKGGKKIKSVGPTIETNCTFRKLKDGFYVVVVQDSKKEGKIEGIKINNNI